MALSRKTIADLLEALNASREYLDGEIDVVDGDYGEPRPNRAMTICNQLDEAITVLDREYDVLTETFDPHLSTGTLSA